MKTWNIPAVEELNVELTAGGCKWWLKETWYHPNGVSCGNQGGSEGGNEGGNEGGSEEGGTPVES